MENIYKKAKAGEGVGAGDRSNRSRTASVFFAIGLLVAAALAGGAEALTRFEARPAPETWAELVVAAKASARGADLQVAREFIEFHDARGLRDHPNTMARTGTQAERDAAIEREREDAQTRSRALATRPRSELIPLLEACTRHSFDDGLALSALEIAYRISPDEFDRLAKQWSDLNPGTASLVAGWKERVRLNP